MAVMQNSIIFGGVDSADYGIYIGGEGTFNAPKRDVEMISIPGRNGAFALDKGRFENIEVTYSAFNYETDLATFAQNLSDFRNAICSQKGYQRLTDTFHTDEYRMAAYISGLEIKPIEYNTASTFDIVFDCKPQRFLTSGETAVTVANNGTLTNPTRFDSRPLLAVTGYGDIGINGETITVQNVALGEIDVTASTSGYTAMLNTANLNTDDPIYVKEVGYPWILITMSTSGAPLDVSKRGSGTNGYASIIRRSTYSTQIAIHVTDANFVKGTNKTIQTNIPLTITVGGAGEYNSASITITTTYTASSDTVTISTTKNNMPTATYTYTYNWARFYGNSTKTLLPTPMYIDLDIGEAYGTINGEITSFNNIVSIPAELPTLKSGTNTFTKSNTVTQLKVTPRYWRV